MGTPLPLGEQIRVAGFTIVVARASYDIWWLYMGKDTRDQYIAGMRAYSEFFRFDTEAHFRAMIVGLYTLFDGRQDTITLASLVRDTKAAGHDVAAIKLKLTSLNDRVAKIKALRHNLFAHRNHSMDYNDGFKAAKLRPDDVKAVLDDSLAIVNELADLKGAERTYLNIDTSNHTVELLRRIQPNPDS